ncbi:hypothetical protein WNY78_16315 [Psychroserpens sp. AS72]|uniref:hypothetical protein n=1 Tax=Psychroserpens sp. AS72 TaxID=3135775 RepID=UPI003182689B
MINQIPDVYGKKFVNGIQHPHLYIWDAWSYVEDDTIHLYSLAVSRLKPDGTELHPNDRNDFPFHIRHFTSVDNGVSWKDQGCFLNIKDTSKHNFKTIWSGSVKLMPNGKKLVAYTGLENIDSNHCFLQSIALGISEDGYTVNHIDDEVLSSPLRDWKSITERGYYIDVVDHLGSNNGEEDGPILSWRDPFVFYDKNEKLNLFWAAKTHPRTGAMARVTLKPKGEFFEIEELHPPVTVPDIGEFTQIEVPKIVYDDVQDKYYLVIASCNRLYENQPDSEINKAVRVYASKCIDGPWESLGDKILSKECLFGVTILKTDFKNNRLLCIAPYTEAASNNLMLTFAPTFYIYLDELRVEFLNQK